jgi:hypothetical protein
MTEAMSWFEKSAKADAKAHLEELGGSKAHSVKGKP